MRRALLVIALATSVLTLGAPQAAHARRFVVVNGYVMSPQTLAALDQAACRLVPNGNYWLDTSNGIWGYAGNPMPQGHIADGCRRAARRPSLSERRMLFSPHDWTR
ncbi:MAG: hypothetical protein ACREM3_09765 [Candidatus Rokuibacteriota bacterium]